MLLLLLSLSSVAAVEVENPEPTAWMMSVDPTETTVPPGGSAVFTIVMGGEGTVLLFLETDVPQGTETYQLGVQELPLNLEYRLGLPSSASGSDIHATLYAMDGVSAISEELLIHVTGNAFLGKIQRWLSILWDSFLGLFRKEGYTFTRVGSASRAELAPGGNATVNGSALWPKPYLPWTWDINAEWVDWKISKEVPAGQQEKAVVGFYYKDQGGQQRELNVMVRKEGDVYKIPVPNLAGKHAICMRIQTGMGAARVVHAVNPVMNVDYTTTPNIQYDADNPTGC